MIIIGCSNSTGLASRIAWKAKSRYCAVEKKYFPDGDLYVRFLKRVKGEHVVIVQSFQPKPQEALVEAVWAAVNAWDLGAKKVTLVAPYLAYMRQDSRFHAGEAVSARIAGELIGHHVDRVITVDPHGHRLGDWRRVFGCPVTKLTANGVVAEYIERKMPCDVVVGPDEESYQWAEPIAAYVGMPAVVLKKKRYTARRVEVRFSREVDLRGKHAVITDDIISTGHTMVEAIKALRKRGAKSVSCVAVHGIFVEGALQKLKEAGAASVVTANTIENSQAYIDVSGLIAESL